mgnify:CR=1 FL=1
MKRVFLIDWVLIPLFILTAYTGLKLHIAGHGSNHNIWSDWAVFHIIVSVLFIIVSIFHITTHWSWFKGLFSKGIGKKSKITVMLSVVFLLVLITGVVLLGVNKANSEIGLWHYKIGIATIILSFGHILKRIHILHKSLK